MPTRQAIREELLDRIYPGQRWRRGTTTGAGGTTSLVDSTLIYTKLRSEPRELMDSWIRMSSGTADEEVSQIVQDDRSTGTLTLSPALSGSTGSGSTYEIWRPDLHPANADDAINRLLRNTYAETFFPLSLFIMGNDANDMEPSTTATDYAQENSGTLATESTIVFNGAQSLKTTANGSGNSGASTGNISVFENKPYYAAVMCSVQQADAAQFYAANVQNSDAQIDDDATTDEPSWSELVILFTPPSGCEQVDMFMLATATGDVAYWDDFQIWFADAGVYPVPSWIEWPEQIIDVRGFPRGAGGPGADFNWRADERASVPLNWHVEREDRRADVPLRIWVEATSARPYIYAHRPFAELTADGNSTNADLDAVVEDAAFLVIHPDRAEQYLSVLRQNRLGGAVIVAPRRVGIR